MGGDRNDRAPAPGPAPGPPTMSADGPSNAMLLCAEGTGKHNLAQFLVELPTDYRLQVRTAVSLPLPQDNESTRPRIDFICFIVDLTNKLSLETVKKSLNYVDVSYYQGRAALLVTKAKANRRAIEVDSVKELADTYGIATLYGDLGNEEEKMSLARRVVSMTETCFGLKNISPLLMDIT